MRYSLAIIAVMVLLAGVAPRAQAHSFLDHSTPAVGSKLKAAPQEVRLFFTDKLDPASSTIEVFDSARKRIDRQDPHLDSSDQSLLCVSLPPLSPGKYKVLWRAKSRDGHLRKGNFAFWIKK